MFSNHKDDTEREYFSALYMEWLQIWYTNGAHMLSKSLTDLPGGYYYRAHNEAAALDTNYAVLETVHVYSNPQYKAI